MKKRTMAVPLGAGISGDFVSNGESGESFDIGDSGESADFRESA